MFDCISILELLLIFGIIGAIFWYSTKQDLEPIAQPTSPEEYLANLLRHVDTKIGPLDKTPIGTLKRDYCLRLQKAIVFYCSMAGYSRLKDERTMRRHLFANNNHKKYREVVL